MYLSLLSWSLMLVDVVVWESHRYFGGRALVSPLWEVDRDIWSYDASLLPYAFWDLQV